MTCTLGQRFTFLTLAASLLTAALLGAGRVAAQQLPPYVRVFGSITVSGANANSGAVVTSYAGSTLCGTAAGTGLYDGSRYFVDIDSSQPPCTAAGATLSFQVNGQKANETLAAPATPGGAAQLNLSVSPPSNNPPGGAPGTVSVQSGWNLVSGPGGTTFSSAVNPLYTLTATSGGQYTTIAPTQSVSAGQGYWAYYNNGATVTLNGTSQASATVTAPAGQFIMIGNPSSSKTVTVSGADVVYTYSQSGGYVQTTQLAPGQGAWAYSAAGATLNLQ